MKFAYYIKKKHHQEDPELRGLLENFASRGNELYDLAANGLEEGTDMVLCFGGDGTLLSAARLTALSGVPLLGVNLGRMGFLADCSPNGIVDRICSGEYTIEERDMLEVGYAGTTLIALNEVSVRRSGAGTLGVAASLDGKALPTYWADGVLVSTSSGSTAYSLSIGGPICMPGVNAFILAPIAPHNLNMRPLIIPSHSEVILTTCSPKVPASICVDNREFPLPDGTPVRIRKSAVPLRKVVPPSSNFIDALRTKLFWGEDVRNSK